MAKGQHGQSRSQAHVRGDWELYRRLIVQARPYWPHLAAIFALSLLATPLALLVPVPLKLVVDSALGLHPLPGALQIFVRDGVPPFTSTLLIAIGVLLAVTALSYLRRLAHALLETWTGERLVLDFRAELFRRVQRLSLAYHDRLGATDSLYRIQYDAPAIQWVAVQGVIPFASAIVTVVAMTCVMAQLDWQLALVALGVSPVLLAITQIFRGRMRREWSAVKKIESSTMSGVQEALSALRLVKAFGQEQREGERFLSHSRLNLRGQMRLARINGSFDGLIELTIAVGTGAALFIGVRHVAAGTLTLGSLLLVMAYLAQLYDPLRTISRKIGDLQASLASAERSFAILDQASEVEDRPHARPIGRAVGAVAFRDVCFAYSDGRKVLDDVCFEVAPGDRVGITGPTGAGKTTLVSLLMRFYDPTSGCILLDGQDLRDLRLSDLRRQFAIVLQEPVLFSTSVAENIAYGRPDASEADIVEAARRANAHAFVSRLSDGYDTQVGERGVLLSGGERQRISIARAFLMDAPLLILDEPTSSVDVSTEAAIVDAMETLMNGRTTFTIAHRPSTLETCNVRFAVDAGRLASFRSMPGGGRMRASADA